MKQILKDILGLFTSVTSIDLLLYFAVLVLIVLIVSLIYIIKTSDEEEEQILETEKEDLKSIVATIETEKPALLELTDYEAEQEEKAIISYEELLAKNKSSNIHYEEENILNDEVTVKKIDLDALLDKPKENKKSACFYNYEREEEFLKKLQTLSKLLS